MRLTASHKNNTSDAARDLLVRPKKQTDSRAVLGWRPNLGCNAFTTDPWATVAKYRHKRVIYITNWFRANRAAVSWSRDIWKQMHERVKSLPIQHVNIIVAQWHHSSTTANQSPVFYQLSLTSPTQQTKTGHRMWRSTLPYLSTCLCATMQLPQMVTPKHSQVNWGCILRGSSTGCIGKIILHMVGRFYHCRAFWHVQKCMAAACCSSHTKNSNIYIFGTNLRNLKCLIQRFFIQHEKWTWYCVHSDVGSKWPKYKICVRK